MGEVFSVESKESVSASTMQILQGNAVIGGIALAKILVLKAHPKIEKKEICDINAEIAPLEAALESVKADMQAEIATADSKSKDVLNAQLMMLEDVSFIDAVNDQITEVQTCAEYAAVAAGKVLAAEFETMHDSYMRARSEDMKQIAQRVADKLTGFTNDLDLHEEVILMAEEFTPAQLAAFDKKYVKGLVAHKGNATSHTAILAGNYGLPYIFGVETDEKFAGVDAVLDAENGCLVLNPSEEKLEWAKAKLAEKDTILAQEEAATKMKVYANISGIEDVEQALKNKADGIGLFRTEFLFMNRDSAPSEEEQYSVYKEVLEAIGNKPVIIRTIDIGTDKPAAYLDMPVEANPALGLRGVRVSLAFKSLFQDQLKALLRAAIYGNLSVMFPMITSVKEIDAIKEQVILAIQELEEKHIAYRMPKFGIMIETPAAAICSEELAKHVDFFSIGTNDLTQYTLALDRQAEGMEAYYEPRHEAILRLIEMTIVGAHNNNIPVGICGQLGADKKILPRLVEAGLDEVSVAIASIPEVRQIILEAEGKGQEDAQDTFEKEETRVLAPVVEVQETMEKAQAFS
ncbi:MAG: phosphoenolpyruvate--protein phosphotransferase, partial [Clostridia bacterium]|nr:phosphoenolpyruvate--protein phosphotransferase [Clostridia bacterium]